MTDPVSRSMTLNEFLESIPIGDIDQDFRNAPYASGLYLIVNTVTWNAYIGQSQTIATRFISHRSDLRRNQHSNHRLQGDWNRYGEAIFRFCVFEIMDASLLYESETQLILSSLGSCYNSQPVRTDLQHVGARVPREQYRRLKARAALDGVSVQTLVEQAIDQLLTGAAQ